MQAQFLREVHAVVHDYLHRGTVKTTRGSNHSRIAIGMGLARSVGSASEAVSDKSVQNSPRRSVTYAFLLDATF